METQSRNFPLNADLLFTENSMKLFVSPKWFVHPGIEPGSRAWKAGILSTTPRGKVIKIGEKK